MLLTGPRKEEREVALNIISVDALLADMLLILATAIERASNDAL